MNKEQKHALQELEEAFETIFSVFELEKGMELSQVIANRVVLSYLVTNLIDSIDKDEEEEEEEEEELKKTIRKKK